MDSNCSPVIIITLIVFDAEFFPFTRHFHFTSHLYSAISLFLSSFQKFYRSASIDMDLFISLPVVLSRSILNNWLPFACVARLDSAYCNTDRAELLTLLTSFVFSVHGIKNEFSVGMIQWLMIRKIYLRSFLCGKSSGDCSACLKIIGSNVTDFTEFPDCSLKAEVGKLCPNLAGLEGDDSLLERVRDLSKIRFLKLAGRYFQLNTDSHLLPAQLQCLSVLLLEESGATMVSRLLSVATESLRILTLCCPEPSQIANDVAACHQLKSLDISYITDDVLGKIVSNCPLIRNLNLSCCGWITDTGMLRVAEHLKELRTLSVSKCTTITSASLHHLQAHHANSLEVLYLEGCSALNLSVSSLYAMFPKLNTYRSQNKHLRAVMKVANVLVVWDDINIIGGRVRLVPGLEILVMQRSARCDIANQKALTNLMTLCPRLHTIAVTTQQQYACLCKMVSGMPRLRVTMEDQRLEYNVFHMPL